MGRHMAATDKDLKRLFVLYGQELRAYLTIKLRNADVADDLVQEAFVRFASQGPAVDVVYDRSYLYRVAHNLAVDHVRRQNRQQTEAVPQDGMAHIPEDRPTQEETVAGRQRLGLLQQAVEELPDLTRRIFTMSRIDGMTYSDIAAALDVSESTVQKHLAKALRHVLHTLDPRET